MHFDYSREQESLRNQVREFAKAEIAPGAEKRDATGEFDYSLYRRVGEMGIIGLSLPREYGGGGRDTLSFCLALEEISRYDMSLAWIIIVSMAGAHSVLSSASEQQKKLWLDEWVVSVIQGKATCATGITEPEGGSDVSRIKTSAALVGDQWRVDGNKCFITGAGLENSAGVVAFCMSQGRSRRFESILIPRGTPGYDIGPRYPKMGLRSCDVRPLAFANCRVPALHSLGDNGKSLRTTMTNLFVGRIILASTALGLAEECLSLAVAYAKERFAFNRPIAEFQYVQGMLTEMALNIELGRNIRDKAIYLLDNGRPFFKEAAMAKWHMCESAKQAADYAVQILGGKGYMDSCPVSRYYRDIRAATLAEGTTQVQRHVVAREMGLMAV